MKREAFLKSHELTWNMRDQVWELTGRVEDTDGKEIRFYFPLSNLPRKMYIRLIEENQQLKELLKQWLHFYPIVLYEYEDTLKTKDIVELYEKTTNAIGENK